MHLFNLACVVTVFIPTFCFVSADYDQEFYQKMRVKAKNCEPGKAIEENNVCNACECVATGVIKCSPLLICKERVVGGDQNTNVAGGDDDTDILGGDQDSNVVGDDQDTNIVGGDHDTNILEAPIEDPVPAQEGDNLESEPTDPAADQSNSKLGLVFKKLRDDATGCKPGEAVPTDSCAGCSCILPGVMRCTAINCLLPQKLDDSEYS